jgi:threonine dehydrogenase-like Zn-dependent dehydrogenase
LHALAGAKVIGCDRSAARVACARAAGVDAVVVETGLKAALGDRLGAGADIVVDATGVAAVIPGAMSLAKHVPLTDAEQPFTRYLLQGSYGGDVTFPYHGAFAKQLSILVPKAHQPRDRFTIMELLARGRLRLRDLISAVRPPEAASATYAELQDPRTSLLTVAFAWE